MLPETRCSEGLRGVAGEVCYGSVCVSIQARRRSRERARVNWSSGRRCRLLSCQWPLNVLLTDTDTDTAWIEAMDGPDANHTHTHTHTCRLLLARTRVSASASLTTSAAFALTLSLSFSFSFPFSYSSSHSSTSSYLQQYNFWSSCIPDALRHHLTHQVAGIAARPLQLASAIAHVLT